MAQGTLFVISAPSGAGKTSLVKALLDSVSQLVVSISYTTRTARPLEIDGQDYHFIKESTFEKMIAEASFLEYAKVHGNYYGTSKQDVDKILAQNVDVILEIDWQGAQRIRQQFSQAISIFIMPPDLEQLRIRLEQRGQDKEEVIAKRMEDALSHLSHYKEFDFIVVNDKFEQALENLTCIIQAKRLSVERQKIQLKELLSQMHML